MGWFSKDGQFANFFGPIPILGHLVAAGQAIAGNTEEAKKAAIQATNSTITAAGSAIGGVVLGPGGAMLGGAVGKGLGIAFEKSVADTVEENVRGSLGQQTLATGAIEIALGAAGGGGGAVGGAAFSGLTQGATTGVAGAAGSFVSSQVGSLVIGGKGAIHAANAISGNEKKEL